MAKMKIVENKLSPYEEKILRKRDGFYIPYRKRTYLYWFKFLQEAEKSDDFKVNWKKYRGWGGANEVLGTKFDHWWEDNWRELFAIEIEGSNDTPAYAPAGRVNIEEIRLSYLVYMLRDTPIDYIQKHKVRYHGRNMGGKKKVVSYPQSKTNSLSIAYRIYNTEISKKRFTRIADLNPDDTSNDHAKIQDRIRSLRKSAISTLEKVSDGVFP